MTEPQTIHKTADYAVTVEKVTLPPDLPQERSLAYFVRHRTHRVVEFITPHLVEAISMAEGLQATLEMVLKDPAEFTKGAVRLPGFDSKGGLN